MDRRAQDHWERLYKMGAITHREYMQKVRRFVSCASSTQTAEFRFFDGTEGYVNEIKITAEDLERLFRRFGFFDQQQQPHQQQAQSIDHKREDKKRKLTAIINDYAATEGEKQAARNILKKLEAMG